MEYAPFYTAALGHISMNPFEDNYTDIDPIEFEKLVKGLLDGLDNVPTKFEVKHNQKVDSIDGEFQIDILVTFEILGADFKVLVECKRYNTNLKREVVQILNDKLTSTGAQKGIIVSASGFQKGAIEYAKNHGIALVRIISGKMTYETKNRDATATIPDWVNLPDFEFQRVEQIDKGSVSIKLLTDNSLTDFLKS